MTERKLVGFDNFVRHNPYSDKFNIQRFHHVEFYSSDATNVSRRFTWGLGMHQVAKSDLSTGNKLYASYVIQGGDIVFAFTAPYNNRSEPQAAAEGSVPHPAYESAAATQFIADHGLAVRAIGIRVDDASEAYTISVANGAVGVLPPHSLLDRATGLTLTISEIKSVDDLVIRWVSGDFNGPFLPNYEPVNTPDLNFGLDRLDHAVTNVPKLFDVVDYLTAVIGLHEFSEFTTEDVGTLDSGLNSMVLASNNEMVLLPINEPTFGTRRKSQIQTFLEHNNGAGLQHLALKSTNIFETVREMKKRSLCGGFEFMPCPSHAYYERIVTRTGEQYSPEKLAELEELGILVDKDDQGVLLQIFTKPLGDRTTVFVEIIQRIGCDTTPEGLPKEQTAGCGGFGKGNFGELFKSIENFEKQQEEAASAAAASASALPPVPEK